MSFQTATVSIGHSTKKSDYDTAMDNTQYNKVTRDGNVTLEGVKTFSSATIFNATATFNSEHTVTGTATVVRFPSKRITSDNFIHADTTYDVIFDKIAPFIPTNGNIILVNGSFGFLEVSRIERIDSSTIRLYGLSNNTLSVGNVTDGGGTAVKVSLAW